ncbi:unnamed protein product [Bemisia tabaci]|uniref:AAA-ATPase-like domain-containing protein n=2 Tax=Bemisia tabaci TaxID=7038 RepID=A0A9P0C7S6_BEMTA|nr:unnamed protein product [Bemisia tabaci]CAH0763010.1 unnamed protein product [Bemisia tabaci]
MVLKISLIVLISGIHDLVVSGNFTSSRSGTRVRSGFEDFKEMLLWSDVFVDKSLFIRDVLEELAKVVVVVRPRNWGKTTNMAMLRRFFETEISSDGAPIAEEARINYRLFQGGAVDLGVDGRHVFKALKITNHSKAMKHMGKYPVISVSFKPIKGYGYARILNVLKVTLMQLFRTHGYLHFFLHGEEKARFERYLVADLTEHDVRSGISFLITLLHKRWNKNVVLLIDDYDTPIISSYWELMEKEKELKGVIRLFRDIFAFSVNSPFVHKCVVTGLVLFEQANPFKRANVSVAQYSLHSEKFTEHFGFTEPEVDELLARCPTSMPAAEIKHYYNGFAWGKHNLFNPHSIMKCLVHDGQLDQYWLDSASSLTIDVRVSKGPMVEDLHHLQNKGLIVDRIYEEINFMEIFGGFRDMWYSLLVMAGYLDFAEDVDETGEYCHLVWIPNQEIKDKFVPKVFKWWLMNDGDCMISINM